MLEIILRRLSTVGLRRGVNGSRPLLYIGILAVGIRTIQRMARADEAESVLYRTAVRPGDVFEIVTTAPPKN